MSLNFFEDCSFDINDFGKKTDEAAIADVFKKSLFFNMIGKHKNGIWSFL